MNRRRQTATTQNGFTPPLRRNLLRAGAFLVAALVACLPPGTRAQEAVQAKSGASDTKAEQEVLALSKDKWVWMSERKVEALEGLFHEKAVFVHMGGNMSRAQELQVIKTGAIHYKKADVQEASARLIGGTTAIVLSRIRLLAVVGGNEVTNPFMVTEVYVQEGRGVEVGAALVQ
jgi:Domain of unknown function (DUF4440)